MSFKNYLNNKQSPLIEDQKSDVAEYQTRNNEIADRIKIKLHQIIDMANLQGLRDIQEAMIELGEMSPDEMEN